MRRAILAAVIALCAASALLIITHRSAQQAAVAGSLFVAAGVPMMLLSRAQLGTSFSPGPKATTLVTHGIYSKIPHPMYVFLDLVLIGFVIALGHTWLVAAWLAVVAIQCWQARRESKVLEQAFGDAYRNYRARTWW
jgi:protein-S-isoprenylcysteine O-methyltransferase Ste14